MEPTGVDVRTGLERLRIAAADGRLDQMAARLGVRVLGVFGSTTRPGSAPPRDLDVAVGFLGPADELALIDELTTLTGTDRIDLLVLDRAEPLARAAGFTGIGLFEATAGAWANEQMAALAECRDTAHLRSLDRQAVGR